MQAFIEILFHLSLFEEIQRLDLRVLRLRLLELMTRWNELMNLLCRDVLQDDTSTSESRRRRTTTDPHIEQSVMLLNSPSSSVPAFLYLHPNPQFTERRTWTSTGQILMTMNLNGH
jgi:hypothetical protein